MKLSAIKDLPLFTGGVVFFFFRKIRELEVIRWIPTLAVYL